MQPRTGEARAGTGVKTVVAGRIPSDDETARQGLELGDAHLRNSSAALQAM